MKESGKMYGSKLRIQECRINNLINPVLDSRPFFSWGLSACRNGAAQRAYRIRVCLDENMQREVWDSSDVESREQFCTMPEGKLCPLTRYYYQILVEDEDGEKAESGIGYFETAKLSQSWKAKWITAAYCMEKGEKCEGGVYLRKEFYGKDCVREARLVISGLGYFEVSINGKSCGDDFFKTPYTDFSKQVQYRVYDVRQLLDSGKNALAVVLGNGFYHTTTEDPWQSSHAAWHDVPKLLCELHISYENGEKEIIVSDRTWKSSRGAIIFNGMRHGEHYDARLEQEGWDYPGFEEQEWEDAVYVRAPGGILHVAELEPVRVRSISMPQKRWKTKEGWIFDVGQNQSGIARICFHGKRGDRIRVRYSDRIFEDGSLDQDSLSGFCRERPFQTDIYIKKGDRPEIWYPRFAYHGFQYLEISGNDWMPEPEDIEVWTLCNDFSDRGSFSCDIELINRIQRMCRWSTISMGFNVMASDTLREQISWTGDTGLSCEQMLLNYAPEAFFRKWQQDLWDAQLRSGTLPCIVPTAGWGYNALNGPDWCHPIYEIPMQMYRYSSDIRMIKDNYNALKRYCSYLDIMAEDGILNYGLGDWCAPFEGPALAVNMRAAHCPVQISDTAYYYSALKAAQRCAQLLLKSEEEAKFGADAYRVKKVFRDRFFDKQTMTVAGDCQTATALMIYHGLWEGDEKAALIQKLAKQIERDGRKLDFGILGVKAVLNSLGEGGLVDLALDMIMGPGYPSLGYWVKQGATTLWECWNGGGSHNHHMFSDVSAFFYKYVAGIMPQKETCGWKEMVIRPAVNSRLLQAAAVVETVRGRVSCSFHKNENETEVLVEIPAGSKAALVLPWLETTLEGGKYSFRN